AFRIGADLQQLGTGAVVDSPGDLEGDATVTQPRVVAVRPGGAVRERDLDVPGAVRRERRERAGDEDEGAARGDAGVDRRGAGSWARKLLAGGRDEVAEDHCGHTLVIAGDEGQG